MRARSRDSREAEFRRSPRPMRGGPTPNAEESALLELQRMVGNAAVAKLLADRARPSAPPGVNPRPATLRGARVGSGATTARPVPVQRSAVVGGQSMTVGDPRLATDKMVEWVEDQRSREYESMNEFEQHAAGNTDYLGNMPSGQWVRFPRTGINVLGERHTGVTLPDMIKVVSEGTPPGYLYEPFSTDDFSQKPRTEAAYRAGLGEVRGKFEVGEDFDWRPHALESLYPKMGEMMSMLLQHLKSESLEEISARGEASYLGKASSRYLKIAWAYAEDVQNDAAPEPARPGLATERAKGKTFGGRLKNLIKLRRSLGSFIKKVPDRANLADELLSDWGKRYQDPVRSFVSALIDELRERGASGAEAQGDGNTELDELRRGFRSQRDRNMVESVQNASGIRYVGVGLDHLPAIRSELRKIRTPGGVHIYTLTDAGPYEDHF